MKKRYGKLMITEALWEDFWKQKGSLVIPHRIEFMAYSKSYEMICEFELFDEIEELDKIPTYILTCERKIEEKTFITEVQKI